MKLADNIYTDIEKNKVFRRALDRIAEGKKYMSFYVVTLPLFSYGLLEIYEFNELRQPYYRKMDDEITIMAISKSKTGAKELAMNILEDHLDQEGVLQWP